MGIWDSTNRRFLQGSIIMTISTRLRTSLYSGGYCCPYSMGKSFFKTLHHLDLLNGNCTIWTTHNWELDYHAKKQGESVIE